MIPGMKEVRDNVLLSLGALALLALFLYLGQSGGWDFKLGLMAVASFGAAVFFVWEAYMEARGFLRSKKERDVGELLSKAEPDDLVKFGIIPELVGRMPVITCLQSLTKDDLVRILVEPKNALIKQYRKLLEMDNVILEIQPEALEAVAEKAIARQIGARGLRAIFEELMMDVMYDVPSHSDIEEVIITSDAVLGKAKPTYVYKEQ